MRSMLAAAFCVLLLHGAPLFAQGVYVSPGANGPVFSDKPQPGAKEVTLRPLKVVAPPPKVEAAPAAAVAPDQGESVKADDPAYRSFTIVSPEKDGSVVANTAVFEVRVAVDPPLQLGDGHAFSVSINGRPVDQRFTATEFMVPPEFWGDDLPAANQQVQLDVSIVDFSGQVLKKAAPVRFYLRYATVLNNPHRPVPRPHPMPPPPRVSKPKPLPPLDLGGGATMN